MAETKVVTKSLAGVEDLLLGTDTVQQSRAGTVVTVHATHMFVPVSSENLLANLNPASFTLGAVVKEGLVTYYKYTTRLGASGINSNITSGVWEVLNLGNADKPEYNKLKSFSLGNTLNYASDALFNEVDGFYYIWEGSLPKTVPAASTPESAGGTGPGKWMSVGDGSLRADLASNNPGKGLSLIGTTNGDNAQDALDKVSDLYAERFGDLTAPDATATMQTAINYAASEKRELKVRTSVINVSQLLLPDNTILNLGRCTLKQIASSNKPLLRNTAFSYIDKTYTNSNITIIDGTLDFNGANQADSALSGELNVGCAFFGVKGLNFNGSTKFINARRYNFFSANCANVYMDSVTIENDPAIPSFNKDGIHFCGKVYDVYINNISVLNPQDDSLALNADDVEHGGEWTRANITGTISGVYVGKVSMSGPASHNGVRMLSASVNTPISNVKIGQIIGSVDNYFLNIESFGLGESCVYHNIDIGNIGGVYSVRSNPTFTQGMVNIYTMKPNGAVSNNIHIGQIFRDQAVGDGQDRPTVQLGLERTSVTIDKIVEQNCANDSVVRITEVGPSVYVTVSETYKSSTRTLTPGIYGSIVSVSNINSNVLQYLKVGYNSADRLRHVVLASAVKINALDIFSDGSADNIPLYLSSAQVTTLLWNSSVGSTYQFYAQRYSLTGTGSAVIIERPAVTGGSTAERPINAIIGDSFYDTTTSTRVNWNGTSWV